MFALSLGANISFAQQSLPTDRALLGSLSPTDTTSLDSLPLTDERRYRWGDIEYRGEPWVTNTSRPYSISKGLYNRHLALWASHGRYYDVKKSEWRWQRPNLYGTTEDLFTQTIVVPYLMPMLENAGAVVFSPRERDWQKHEVIIDNDDANSGVQYLEVDGKQLWRNTNRRGFAYHSGNYQDRENPFVAGSARMVKTTATGNDVSIATYQPNIPEAGRYAVYVSYQTLENSVDDVSYTVWHQGQATTFKVNQQMGGGTWVYLGTFEFDRGSSIDNRVIVSNLSDKQGVVTTDAVRFGGGMGNIERFGLTSNMPRCLEGARYYAQWAGMPDTIYTQDEEVNDYKDDINVRSRMTNYIGGGSCYMPTLEGRRVPLELSLGVHSDAGYSELYDSLTSTLTICTTKHNEGLLNSGISRYASYEFANDLLETITSDLKAFCGDWYNRGILNRNYSESRLPEVPSAILETLSHQNFLDMKVAQDPNFRFHLARAVYKTILRHVAKQHDVPYIVTPLAPKNFRIEFTADMKAKLTWEAHIDPLEKTARPKAYVVYTSVGSMGYDNGVLIDKGTSHTTSLIPGSIHKFKVTAVNDGGESFPTEELCIVYNPEATKTIAIVNGFSRLSSPAIIQNDSLHGFSFDEDPGITLGSTFGWAGRQVVFERGYEAEEPGLFTGWSNDDFAGMLIAGNDRDYTITHAEAINTANKYNIVSCSGDFVDNDPWTAYEYLSRCNMIDLILGLQHDDGRSLVRYKTFSPSMQSVLREYTDKGGALLVSGAYVGRDMQSEAEQKFLRDVLKCYHAGVYKMSNNKLQGMGTTMNFYNDINEKHYSAISADILQAEDNAFSMLLYSNGNSAGIAYSGKDYRSITLGIPFECLTSEQKQRDIMGGLLNFLLE